MYTKEIVISKRLMYRIVLGLGLLIAILLAGGKISIFNRMQKAPENTSVDSATMIPGSAERFAMLSNRGNQDSIGST